MSDRKQTKKNNRCQCIEQTKQKKQAKGQADNVDEFLDAVPWKNCFLGGKNLSKKLILALLVSFMTKLTFKRIAFYFNKFFLLKKKRFCCSHTRNNAQSGCYNCQQVTFGGFVMLIFVQFFHGLLHLLKDLKVVWLVKACNEIEKRENVL